MKRRIINYIFLLIYGLILTYSYSLAVVDKVYPLEGYKYLHGVLVFFGIALMIFLLLDIRGFKDYALFISVIFMSISILVNLYIVINFDLVKPIEARSSMEYSYESSDRELIKTGYTYKQFYKELRPAFHDLLKDKTIIVDSSILNDHRLIHFRFFQLRVHRIVIEDSLSLESTLSDNKYQNIVFKDLVGSDEYMHIYTGSGFDKSENIYLISNNDVIVMVGDLDIDVELYSATDIFMNRDWKDSKYKQVNLELVEDKSIQRVLSPDNSLNSLFFMAYLFITGIIFMIPMARYMSNCLATIFGLAFVISSAYHVLFMLLMGIMRIPITIYSVIFLSTVIMLVWNMAWNYKSKHFKIQKIDAKTIVILVLNLIAIILFSFEPKVFMTNDSYYNILIGKQIAQLGTFDNSVGFMLMFSLINPLWHVIADMFGVMLNSSIQPIFITSGIIALFVLQYEVVKDKGLKNSWVLGILVLTSLSVFSTMEYLLNSVWLLNNAVIGIMTALAVVLVDLYVKKKSFAYIVIVYVFFLVTGLARLEGALFSVLFVVYLLKKPIQHKIKIFFTVSFTGIYTLYTIYNTLSVDVMKDGFWSLTKAGMIIMVLVILSFFVTFYEKIQKLSPIISRIDVIMLMVIFLVGLTLYILEPSKITNVINFLQNVVSNGYYGVLVPLLGICTLLYFNSVDVFREEVTSLLLYIAGYILLIIALMMFSIYGIRLGFGDSSCRMLLHILPTAGILLSYITIEMMRSTNLTSIEKRN